MGFFWKIFKKDNGKLSVFQNDKMRMTLYHSFNYRFVFWAVKRSFFEMNFDKLYGNKNNTRAYLNGCADYVVSNCGLRKDVKFYNLKFYYASNSSGDKSIVVEFPGPWTVETECNYIALHKTQSGEISFYTSEYYENKKEFKLCQEELDKRINWGIKTQSLNEFLEAIKQQIVRL